MPATITLTLVVVISPWDDAIGSESTLRRKDDAIDIAVKYVENSLNRRIGPNEACSVILAEKLEAVK